MQQSRKYQVLLCAFLAISCSANDAAPTTNNFTEVDSAGITIATNDVPLSALHVVWTLEEPPVFRVGSLGGDAAYQFNRINSAVLLDGGRIAVGEDRPPEVRIFDSAGRHIVTHGRAGSGPGEFASLHRVFGGSGDTIIAVDGMYARSRAIRFTIGAGHLDDTPFARNRSRELLPDSLLPAEGVLQLLPDGAMILGAESGAQVNHDLTPSGQPFRPGSIGVWFSEDMSRTRVLTRFQEMEQMFVDAGDGRRTIAMPLGGRWGRSATSSRSPVRFCHANNDAPELHCVNSDGSYRIIRWVQQSTLIPSDSVAAWKKRHRERSRGAGAERIIAAALIHDTWPPIRGLSIASDHSVLVGTVDLNSPAGMSNYRVFSPSGELLGLAVFPESFWITDILGDDVIGVALDSTGLQSVVRYRLRRATGG
jgi:hypothetical protein